MARTIGTSRKITPSRQTETKRRWGDKKTSVEIDDKTGILFGHALDKIYPGIIEKMENTTISIYNDAYDNWPERTGYSKSKLHWDTLISMFTISCTIYADADYTKYIHKPTPFDSVYIWQELLIKPQKLKSKQLVLDLTNQIPKDLVEAK